MSDEGITQLLEEGLRHHVLGDDDKAIACWQRILALSPGNERALRLLDMVARSRRKGRPPAQSGESGRASHPTEEVGRGGGEPRGAPPSPQKKGRPPAVAPDPSDADEEIASYLMSAEELIALGDFSGALVWVEKILQRDPTHAKASDHLGQIRKTLTHFYESKLGSVGAKPKVLLRPDELLWLNLDHRAGFVLSQIDGNVSVNELYMLSGMSRMETAKILAELLEAGAIGVDS